MTIEELADALCYELTKDYWPDWLVSVGHSDRELYVYVNSLVSALVPHNFKNHRVKTRPLYLDFSRS
jgi:hypothetical protein